MYFIQPQTAWACHLNLTLPCGFSRWLNPAGSWQHPRIKLLTQTLVGRVPSGPGPGSVLVKGVTSLAVGSHCVMLAGTDQATLFPFNALAGMTVTLTSKGNMDTLLRLQLQSILKPTLFFFPLHNYVCSEWNGRGKGISTVRSSFLLISHGHKISLRLS